MNKTKKQHLAIFILFFIAWVHMPYALGRDSAFITAIDENNSTFEIAGFESESPHRSKEILNVLKKEIQTFLQDKSNHKLEVHVLLGDDFDSHGKLNLEALKFAKQVASLSSRISVSKEKATIDPVIEKTYRTEMWQQQAYRMTFALIRGLASGGAMASTLIITAAAPLEVIVPIATISGFMSGSFQYYAREFHKWTENTGMLAKLLGHKNTKQAPEAIHRSESFFRWYLAQLFFAGVLKSSMALLGMTNDFDSFQTLLAATGHVALSSIYATWAQGTWERAITTMRHHSEAQNILSKSQIDFRTNAKYLAAGISATIILAMDFLGFRGAQIGYFAMGGLGMVAYLKALGAQKNHAQNIKNLTSPQKKTSASCRILLKAVKI